MSGPAGTTDPDVGPTFAVGCDVVATARIAGLLARHEHAAERLFSARELADATRGGVELGSEVAAERLAARFAAKEAARKALGGRGPDLGAIEVHLDEHGRPSIVIDGRPSGLACSLSHDSGIAMAVVVADPAAVARLLGDRASDAG
jgi:holo-[acyl-carrier protein] synthase